MQGQFNLDSNYVLLTLNVNARRLRWEISRIPGDNSSLNRMAHYPSKCNFCDKSMMAIKNLEDKSKAICMPCCYKPAHIQCVKSMYTKNWGHCAFCSMPYLFGKLETVGTLGQIFEVSLIRKKGVPPESYKVNGEIFKFVQPPLVRQNELSDERPTYV